MRLIKARVQKYRSIRDTGEFEIDPKKTILVGPNEAGKTALLRALQQINPPEGVPKLDPLRDYPRSEYNDITTGKVKPEDTDISTGWFELGPEDKAAISEKWHDAVYVLTRLLDGNATHTIEGGAQIPKYGDIAKDLNRFAGHVDGRVPVPTEGQPPPPKPVESLAAITKGWTDTTTLQDSRALALKAWLDAVYQYADETNSTEEARYDKLFDAVQLHTMRDEALKVLGERVPVLVLFNNYFRVRPSIHLLHLAKRLEDDLLDDDQYDYGNECLLKLLGFTARELSDLGSIAEPHPTKRDEFQEYKDNLDKRAYQLNAASVRLTDSIVEVWRPDHTRDEAARIRIVADRQYLKAVVEDSLGVEIELDQRSEGFQWLVSFFVVFFAETMDKHKNAILLLDEPGLSLHGLKQREFRTTVSRLAESNQTIYTTHSPFLVGPDELDIVRVVEMKDRRVGTKVLTTLTSSDPAGLLPLQEALGYDLAQSLFAQERNLVLEGLTDYWYLQAASEMLNEAGIATLNPKIAMVPSNSAGKVVYFATILHAQNLKVAALLDSDTAGDQAAQQDVLVHTLRNNRILRTKDVYTGAVSRPEIEELLRETLIQVAKSELSWDVAGIASSQPTRSIVDIFQDNVAGFSKYKLAKAFLRWSRTHAANDLTSTEQEHWKQLIARVNKALN